MSVQKFLVIARLIIWQNIGPLGQAMLLYSNRSSNASQ